MKILELIAELQKFNQNSIYVSNKNNMEDAYKKYTNLSKTEIDNKKYFGFCGQLCYDFQKLLLNDYDIPSRYIGIYHRPVNIEFSNREFLEQYNNYVEYQKTFKYEDILSTVRNTHVLLEINVGNQKRIIDPTNGIYYIDSKENLLRGINVKESLLAYNQLDVLKKSIHINLKLYYYLTRHFWLGIYYIGYDNGSGGDITTDKDYNKYEDDQLW